MLKQGEPVAELVIENPLRLWTNVPERYSDEVKVGQPVRSGRARIPDTIFEGKVAGSTRRSTPSAGRSRSRRAVPNNRGLLRPGGFAKASIVTSRGRPGDGRPHRVGRPFAGVTKLFVVEGDKAHAINVETGLEGQGWVEVIGELPAEAQVVTTGQIQLADGTPVVIRSATPDPAACRNAAEAGRSEPRDEARR